jgi:hypothetical protein
MARWIRFFIVLILGFCIGLVYGWLIDPVEYVDTDPDTLRIDYKTDYVLMVAEAYQADKNIDLAVDRLAFLGFTPPQELVEEAMDFGIQAGYTAPDLGLLRVLGDALQVQWSTGGEVQP